MQEWVGRLQKRLSFVFPTATHAAFVMLTHHTPLAQVHAGAATYSGMKNLRVSGLVYWVLGVQACKLNRKILADDVIPRRASSSPVIQGAQGPGEGADRREVGEAQEPVRRQGLVEGRMLLVLYSKTTPFFMRGLLRRRPSSFETWVRNRCTEHGTKPRGLCSLCNYCCVVTEACFWRGNRDIASVE